MRSKAKSPTSEDEQESILATRAALSYLEIASSKSGFLLVVLGLRFAQMMALQQGAADIATTPEVLLEKFNRTVQQMQASLLQEVALSENQDVFETTH